MKYKILEHKADIKIKVFGGSLEELFKNAAGAMAQILSAEAAKSEFKIQNSKCKIKVESLNKEVLLADFLNEILGQSQINKSIYNVFNLKLQDSKLEAEISGYPIERFDEDIKAVTYYDLSIRETQKGIWEATILFDV